IYGITVFMAGRCPAATGPSRYLPVAAADLSRHPITPTRERLVLPRKNSRVLAPSTQNGFVADRLDPKRTVADLKELRSLTGDENGAQRVAFTPSWAKARKWLRGKIEETGAEIHTDAAGNLWATL